MKRKPKHEPADWSRYNRCASRIAIYDGNQLVRITTGAAFACHFPLGGLRVVILEK
jgi:hypothetical protein